MRRPNVSRNADEPSVTPHEKPIFEEINTSATALGISRTTVRSLIDEGELDAVRIRRRKLVVRASRDAYAARLMRQPIHYYPVLSASYLYSAVSCPKPILYGLVHWVNVGLRR